MPVYSACYRLLCVTSAGGASRGADYITATARVLENIPLERNLDQNLKFSAAHDAGDYFLPNLCQGSAVFMLVLVTELIVLTMALAASGIRSFAWEDFALISLFVLWIVLFSAALLCLLRKPLAGLSLQWSVVAVFSLILVVTALFSVLADWALAGADLSSFHMQVDAYDLLRNLLVSAVMAGMVLRYFYVHAQLRRQERAELQARIQALQSRINPHFLFNSMNSIASLIGSAPALAEQAIEDLCELFRASLRETAEPVALNHELELCRRYLAIEQLRLGERLQVNWQVNDIPEQAELPLLTLQPILENAVYHGIQPLPQGGEIVVSVEVSGKARAPQLLIRVSNPVGDPEGDKDGMSGAGSGHNMALDNIRHRLAALYGDQARLKVEQRGGLFVTSLKVPIFGETA